MCHSLIWVTHSLLSETLKSINQMPSSRDTCTMETSKNRFHLQGVMTLCQRPCVSNPRALHGFLQNHPPNFGQLHFSVGGSIDQKTSPEKRLCRFLALQDTTLRFSKSLSWTTVFEELLIEQHHCVSLVRSSNSRSHPAMTANVCNANYNHAVSQYLPRNQCYPRPGVLYPLSLGV